MKHTQKMAQRMLEKAWQRRDVYGAEIREWRAAGWIIRRQDTTHRCTVDGREEQDHTHLQWERTTRRR